MKTSFLNRASIVISVLLLLFAALDAKAATFTIFLDPSQDATLDGDPANFVADRLDRGDANITVRSLPGDVQRLILEFPISELVGFNIDSAVFSFSIQGSTVNFIAYQGDGVTELTDWFPNGGTVLTLFTAPLPNTKTIETIDVTAALNSRLENGETFFGIQIRAIAGDEAIFFMTEALGSPDLFNGGPVDSTMIPQLQVQATPIVPVPTQCEIDLADALADLNECLSNPPTPDEDGDGEADSTDACPGTLAGAEVDAAGCSLEQFCSTIDTSTSKGRRQCRRSDWMNDEPPPTKPADCKVEGSSCVPSLN